MEDTNNGHNNNNNKGDDKIGVLHPTVDEERGSLKREREQFEEEKATFERNHKKAQLLHSEPIQLNIGGVFFSSTLDTLTKYRDSFFGAMFSGLYPLKVKKDGSYFIDRDGTHFHYILNFLRAGELIVPKNEPHLLRMLLLEAEFYQIKEVVAKLDKMLTKMEEKTEIEKTIARLALIKPPDIFVGSTVLPKEKTEWCEKLNEWAGYEKNQKWKLLYTGSGYGFKASIFHQTCDNKGETFTIVKSGISIFGGFNQHSWDSSPHGDFGDAEQTFLFSLVNIYGLEPVKLEGKLNQPGPYYDDNSLPSFGESDLVLSDDGNIKTDNINTFENYDNPTFYPHLFTGLEKFQVDEIEVFARM